jgi:hypothetical protein
MRPLSRSMVIRISSIRRWAFIGASIEAVSRQLARDGRAASRQAPQAGCASQAPDHVRGCRVRSSRTELVHGGEQEHAGVRLPGGGERRKGADVRRRAGREADELLRELFGQASAARYEPRRNLGLRWGVPEREGHDDLLNALVLCVQGGGRWRPGGQ